MIDADPRSRLLILALDYGGSKHAAALAAPGSREWLARDKVLSPAHPDADGDRRAMVRLARGLLEKTPGKLAAVGVSFGGPVDPEAGRVKLSHHVPGWEDAPLRDELEAQFAVPAAMGNDANVAGLGEHRFGAGRGVRSMLYINVSTGIGGGWILGGKIYTGADHMAGEIGHVVVRPGGAPCVCGKRGCLEAEACGPAMVRKMAQRGAGDDWTAEKIAHAAAAGNAMAREVLEEAARLLGAGLGGAVNLMNPELILIGGGVTGSGERWWDLVREAARAHALPECRVEIRPAALADDAPLWGAVALARERLDMGD